jgi:hypothetical protein
VIENYRTGSSTPLNVTFRGWNLNILYKLILTNCAVCDDVLVELITTPFADSALTSTFYLRCSYLVHQDAHLLFAIFSFALFLPLLISVDFDFFPIDATLNINRAVQSLSPLLPPDSVFSNSQPLKSMWTALTPFRTT